MKNNYIFIFTIGPVQSFIAQARKTQDLYAGSQLLSELIFYATETARQNSVKSEFELIFPFLKGKADSLPNRFVALLEPKEDIQKFGSELARAVRTKLMNIASDKLNGLFDTASSQIADFLETYWAALPYNEAEGNAAPGEGVTYYQSKMAELEQLLGSVKNYRDYRQFAEEPGRKCSVNGYYNALFYRRTNTEVSNKTDIFKSKHLSPKALVDPEGTEIRHLDRGEGICGVTMLRRFYRSEKSFPSVSRVALLNLLEKLEDEPELKRFVLPFGGLQQINEQLFYEENLTEDLIKDTIKVKTDIREVRNAYSALKSRADSDNIPFLKYYAIIVFDADDMGKQFSACKTREEHNLLSNKLSDYAEWAKDFINNNKYGSTIYAGGDDYMGMLNLATLFEAVEGLRIEFDRRFKDLKMTFSAGIAIAHYKTPLGEVLNYSRKMEKKAKNRRHKNAFGIVVMKHSGEILEAVLPWTKSNLSSDHEDYWNTSSLSNILTALNNGLSPAFIKNLYRELTVWEKTPDDYREQSNYEIARYVNRASGNNRFGATIKNIQDLYALVDQEDDNSNQNFLNILSILDFLNRKI